MAAQNKQFDELLDKSYNEYSHEGEFDIQGWKVIIFRKTNEMYADCGAFVSNKDYKYFTGWYEEELGNDLKTVMYAAIKFMFGHGLKAKIQVNGNFDMYENELKKNIKTAIKNECIDAITYLNGNTDSLKLNIDFENETFTATFIGNYDAWLAVKNNDYFFSATFKSVNICHSAEMQFLDQDIKDFTEQAFTYSMSFY